MQDSISVSFSTLPRVENNRIVASSLSIHGPIPPRAVMAEIYKAAVHQLRETQSSFLATGESISSAALTEMKQRSITTEDDHEENEISFDVAVVEMMTKRMQNVKSMTLRCWSLCDQLDLDVLHRLFENNMNGVMSLISGPSTRICWESVEHLEGLIQKESGCGINLSVFLQGEWNRALSSFLYFCARSKQVHYKQVVLAQNNMTDVWQRVSLGPTLSNLLKYEMLEGVHKKSVEDKQRIAFEQKLEDALISGLEKAEECVAKSTETKNGLQTIRCKISRVVILFERCLNFQYNINLHSVIRRRINKLIPHLKFAQPSN